MLNSYTRRLSRLRFPRGDESVFWLRVLATYFLRHFRKIWLLVLFSRFFLNNRLNHWVKNSYHWRWIFWEHQGWSIAFGRETYLEAPSPQFQISLNQRKDVSASRFTTTTGDRHTIRFLTGHDEEYAAWEVRFTSELSVSCFQASMPTFSTDNPRKHRA